MPGIQRPTPGVNHCRFLCSLSKEVLTFFHLCNRPPPDSHTIINIGLSKVIAGENLDAKLGGLVGVFTGIRVVWTFSLFLDTFTYIFPHQHPEDWSLEKWLCLWTEGAQTKVSFPDSELLICSCSFRNTFPGINTHATMRKDSNLLYSRTYLFLKSCYQINDVFTSHYLLCL